MHALGLEFGSAAQLSKRPGSVWNCLWGNALKRSPGIIRKSRVSYPGPGFLSSATWPSLLKEHYNGLNQTEPIPGKHSGERLIVSCERVNRKGLDFSQITQSSAITRHFVSDLMHRMTKIVYCEACLS